MARRVGIEFVGDRLADARLAQAYVILAPERRRATGNERRDDEREQRQHGGAVGGRPGRVAAIYARVSSDRQRREQTIQSQTAALRELAAERGLLGPEDLVFEDEGVSGAVLRRPLLQSHVSSVQRDEVIRAPSETRSRGVGVFSWSPPQCPRPQRGMVDSLTPRRAK